MIESVCPNCGEKKIFEDDKMGKKYKCPVCSNAVTIEKIDVQSSMTDEEILEVNEVKVSILEKVIIEAKGGILFVVGAILSLVTYLIIAYIFAKLGFDFMSSKESGGEHETLGILIFIAMVLSTWGYIVYVKYFKKY